MFAKSQRAELGSIAKDSIISGFDVSVFDETIARDCDFQLGELGSVEELPVLERFKFLIPAKLPDRFGAGEERVG